MLGVMIDCSRNAVMTVSAVKNYIDILVRMGYDTVLLYTEDTIEIDGEPYFGYMRGRYSKEELKEIDNYCVSNGVELIPCIQTLAHLDTAFQITNNYYDILDCDDILLVGNDKTYNFIENMISTISEIFTSRNIHIGMDEAGKVGLGKYLSESGYEDRFNILNKHLHRVCDIVGKYGFKPMIWSDMFCRLASGSDDYYTMDFEKIKSTETIPENISLVYWDYYSHEYEHYMEMFCTHSGFDREICFAGGAWTWKGFTPDNQISIWRSEAALKACRDRGVSNVIITMWGDDGAECSRLSVLPTLFYIAESYNGNFDIEKIKEKFKAVIGMNFDDFMLLDLPNTPGGKHEYNPSKYLLYNDLFTGLNDYRIDENDGELYKNVTKKLKAVSVKKEYQLIFNTQITLSELLEIKATLGVKTRKAYKDRNNEALRTLAEKDYMETIRRIELFYDAFSKQWNAENKPFGFDIQDLRLGGMIQRLKGCSARLLDFVNGKIETIPELEEEILPGTGKINWLSYATPNVISHALFR